MAITKVVMPKLSEAMETGKISKWLKKEGDRVQGGDILAEIETDKADVEMEAFGAGVLRKILVSAGEKAPVGTLIGVIAEPAEDIAAALASAPATAVAAGGARSEEHTSELQSLAYLVCRLLLEKKKTAGRMARSTTPAQIRSQT